MPVGIADHLTIVGRLRKAGRALAAVILAFATPGMGAEPPERIVAVRDKDGLIQVLDGSGKVERSFGAVVTVTARGASAERPNTRVAVGDVLGLRSPQVLTAVQDSIDPCRRIYDPHSGRCLTMGWSKEGRHALDVSACKAGALTVNEKRNAAGEPTGSYWNCYDVRKNDRVFHTEWTTDAVAIAAGELDAGSAGDEVATVTRAGKIQIWDTAAKDKDPVVLRDVMQGQVRHTDVAIGDVLPGGGAEVVAAAEDGRIRIYRSATGKLLTTLDVREPVRRVGVGDVHTDPGVEILAVTRGKGDVLATNARGAVVLRIKATPGSPFVDVAAIGQIKPAGDLTGVTYGFQFGPVSEIRKGKGGDVPWRVEALTFENGGAGLLKAYACLFTIRNYWAYGCFSSKTRCELPGKLFRARASGKEGDRHHFLTPACWGAVNRYRMVDGRLYVAWRVRAPRAWVEGGRFSCVRPSRGPWEVWCNLDKGGKAVWTVEVLRDGRSVEEHVQVAPQADGWFDVQLTADPGALTLQVSGERRGRFAHDAYAEPFYIQFGSKQSQPGGGEVVSEYREVFVDSKSYPYQGVAVAEGPEDIRPQDRAVVGYVHKAAPKDPRVSEGDLIVTRDGHLLAVYSHYYAGVGYDGSPARLVGRISKDGGKTWSAPWTVADRDAGSHGNVMSVSLLRGRNGDLLMAYYDKAPDMPAKGMVLRRSSDEGKTWSKRVVVTPTDRPNRHSANNACLTRLTRGRIVLATREYVGGIRWPYACISDDDGRTWRAGNHVPDPGLTPYQKSHQNVNEPSICELTDGGLLMTMRSIAGGQFFAWSSDQGETWSKPVLSPLRGTCSPAILRRIPNSRDILAVWTYGYAGRTPLVSAISSDGGRTWKHLKLVEQSEYHGYCYGACTFVGDRVVLAYMHFPMFSSLFRFEVEPGYIDLRFVSLPIKWFYRNPRGK